MTIYSGTTIEEALEYLQNQVNILRKKAEDNIPKFKSLLPAPKKSEYGIDNPASGYFTEKAYWSGTQELKTVEAVNKKMEDFKVQVTKYLEAYKKYTEECQVIKEHNELVSSKLKLVMEQAGISSKYTEYGLKTPRSRKNELLTRNAGYLQDIERYNKTFTSYASEERSLKVKLDDYETHARDLCYKINEEQRKKEKALKEKEMLHRIAALRVKYTPENYNSSIEDIFESLINKDQYLALADAMVDCRNNWNNGCKSVYYALCGLKIETAEDEAIFAELSEICNNFEDGRQFRDCKYNYDYIFSKMKDDDSLYTDYENVKEMLDEDY